MRQFFTLFAAALLAGTMFTACGGDDDPKGGGTTTCPPGPDDLTITNATSGEIKIGSSAAVTIEGTGFDPEMDLVCAGYEVNGKMFYDPIDPSFVEMKETRIIFGLPINAPFLDQLSVRFYLDRPGYEKIELTKDITFKMPTVEEGYIPDPIFRTYLSANPHNCPAFQPLFDKYGMLNVAEAAKIESCGSKDGWTLDLAGCQAKSIEGIELFTGIKPKPGDGAVLVAAWGMSEVKKIDLSKWKLKNIDLRLTPAATLEEFVGSPYLYCVAFDGCTNLKKVDLSPCRWLVKCWLKKDANSNNVNYLDVRRDRSGSHSEAPADATQYTEFNGDSYFNLTDNATVLIDSHFLTDHAFADNNGNPTCWGDIHNAWKRGATIKVYSKNNISTFLDTAPMYSVQPDALSPKGPVDGVYQEPNKWTVTEPAQ